MTEKGGRDKQQKEGGEERKEEEEVAICLLNNRGSCDKPLAGPTVSVKVAVVARHVKREEQWYQA